MAKPTADYQVFNVGTGQPTSVLRVAELLAEELGWNGDFEITGKFRAGDIRHCFADISRIRELIGYEPRYGFEDGVSELVAWVREQQAEQDLQRPNEAAQQLAAHGLVR
jgi:dTDP-L-rhamnose 4-epimerase